VAAYVASSARKAQLLDVARAAYAELERIAPGSPLLAALDARLHPRMGAGAVKAACAGVRRSADADCFDAHRDRGDFDAALAELARLRVLRGAPTGLRELELSTRIQSGDRQGALQVYDAMEPGQRRMLDVLGFAAGHDSGDARSRLARDRLVARDTPFS